MACDFGRLARCIIIVVITLSGTVRRAANADGSSPTTLAPADGFLAHFESFRLNNCIPFVREYYYIATVAVSAVKTPSLPGVAALSGRASTRSGQLRFELL